MDMVCYTGAMSMKELPNPYEHFFLGNRWELPPRIELINPAVEELRRRMHAAGWDEETSHDLGLGLDEALTNSMLYGSLGMAGGKKKIELLQDVTNRLNALREEGKAPSSITVEIDISNSEIKIILTDQGKGFDESAVPNPTLPENLTKGYGRGILLIRHYFDNATYSEGGRKLELIKRRGLA